MYRRFTTTMAFLAVGWLALAGALGGEDKDEGFVPLFNGKDLDGWVVKGKADGWQVKDGVLRSDGAKGGDWIRTAKEYGDFILKVDWKVSKGGNSGVFIRVPDKGAPWQTGYEVQISNDPRDEKHCTGALYGYAAVKPRPDESADKWHTFEIHCVGPQIKVIVRRRHGRRRGPDEADGPGREGLHRPEDQAAAGLHRPARLALAGGPLHRVPQHPHQGTEAGG